MARLGAGGMGEVFLARTASGRPLALKTVHRDLSREPGFAERFAREIRTNDRVRSPWTVSVVDFSPPDTAPQWLATEYVAAPSLADWVHRHGPLPEPAVRCLARELSAALVSVRAAGVVHRDIKPGNVLLGAERPYLIDFGIARAVRDPRRTRTGTVMGTPGYLAPEQATGAVAAAPADVFSLAAVLVYAATGRSPFVARGEEPDLPALLYRIVHDEPLLDGVPDALLPLVGECLAKNPEQRPTAEEVRARLETAGEQEWHRVVPPALVAAAGSREAELRGLLAAAQPPVYAPVAAPPAPLTPPVPPATAPGTPRPAEDLVAAPSRTRKAVLAALAVALVAFVIVMIVPFGGGDGDGDGDGDGKDGTAPAGTPAPSPSGQSPAVTSLPAAWVGTWTGLGPGTPDADGVARARTQDFAVTVTLHAGAVGDVMGAQVSNLKEIGTGRNLGCTEALELRQMRGNTAVLAAVTSHPTDRSAAIDCPRGNLYLVTMTEPDRLTLESEGAQSAGAPAFLTRGR
ncbi:serine/threonine protein kinase [Streptomyces venezuelae]|uniref:Serine/threonine protein kinase n=1 Tax=Streptomyces venezuelae TaxID=54571 RepID=A0A5P2CUZ6_STRVZ|nr:serine/threonine-protein kinase [Streptomyces venezuelae]QES46675.1 serine/threonine protein kinase [Streptomyces venezuelae]